MNNILFGKRKRKSKENVEKRPAKKKKLNSGQEAKITRDLFVLEASNGNVDYVKGLYKKAKNKYALDYLGAQLAAKSHFCQNILDYFSEDEEIKKNIREQIDFQFALESKNTLKLKELIEKQPQLLDSKINGTYPLFIALNKGHAPSARMILKSLKKTSVLNYIEGYKNGQGLNAIEDANKNKLETYARILINALPRVHRTRYIGEGWVKRVKHTFQTHNDKVSEARGSKSNLALSMLYPIYNSLPSFAFGPVAGVTALGLNFSSMLASYGASELVAASHKYLPTNVSRIVQPVINDAMLQLQAYNCYQNPISYLGGLAGAHIATEIASFTDNPEIMGAAHFAGARLGEYVATLDANYLLDANLEDKLKKEFTQQYQLLLKKIDVARSEAREANKPLMILIGENHGMISSGINETIVLNIAEKKLDIKNVMTEYFVEDVMTEHFAQGVPPSEFLRPKHFIKQQINEMGFKQIALDASLCDILKPIFSNEPEICNSNSKYTQLGFDDPFIAVIEKGMRVRNNVMAQVAIDKLDGDTVAIVGVAHLYGLLKETNLSSYYHVLPINADHSCLDIKATDSYFLKNMKFACDSEEVLRASLERSEDIEKLHFTQARKMIDIAKKISSKQV